MKKNLNSSLGATLLASTLLAFAGPASAVGPNDPTTHATVRVAPDAPETSVPLDEVSYPATPEDWQAEEDAYVDLASRLEAQALRTTKESLALDEKLALEILDGDYEMLEHFQQKIRILNESGRAPAVADGSIAHPLFGERADYLNQRAQPKAGTPLFYLPFGCGTRWSAASYTGHTCGYNETLDWTRGSATAGSAVIASAPGTAYVRRQTTCGACTYRNECGTVPSKSKGYGNYINVVHSGGYETRYAHLASFSVADGYVYGGQQIGTVGMTGCATGPHLHGERRLNGACVLQNFVEGSARPGSVLTSANCSCRP